MKLYHGGTVAVQKPEIIDSQRFLDFGKGFYVTTNPEQAERWAKIKQKRKGNDADSIVSVYDFDEEIFNQNSYKIKSFNTANEEWLDFIVVNRKSHIHNPYDIIIGAVANDTLYSTLVLFEAGILSKAETIIRLKAHKLFGQISFHNEKALNELVFSHSYQVK
jgi:hypothetical protein